MMIWLVTVRAAEGRSERVRALLQSELLPLLRATPDCRDPQLAACVNCAGEHTYLAFWPERSAVERLEADPTYRATLDRLSGYLPVPPKRELWEILA